MSELSATHRVVNKDYNLSESYRNPYKVAKLWGCECRLLFGSFRVTLPLCEAMPMQNH